MIENVTHKDTIEINGKKIPSSEGSVEINFQSKRSMTVMRSRGMNVYSVPTIFKFDLKITCIPGSPDDLELKQLFLNQKKYIQ